MLPLVFTRAEVLAAGFDSRTIDARVRSGVWTALRRGVYAEAWRLPAAGAARHAAEIAAAARATGQEVVGSHESAALVHGLTTFAGYDGPPVLSRCREPKPSAAAPLPDPRRPPHPPPLVRPQQHQRRELTSLRTHKRQPGSLLSVVSDAAGGC